MKWKIHSGDFLFGCCFSTSSVTLVDYISPTFFFDSDVETYINEKRECAFARCFGTHQHFTGIEKDFWFERTQQLVYRLTKCSITMKDGMVQENSIFLNKWMKQTEQQTSKSTTTCDFLFILPFPQKHYVTCSKMLYQFALVHWTWCGKYSIWYVYIHQVEFSC